MVDVGDEDRDPLGGDPAGEALADRDPNALLDLLLDPLGRARDELLGPSSSSRIATVSTSSASWVRTSSSSRSPSRPSSDSAGSLSR